MSAANGTNNEGHGHVYPRPDGVRMRCGGPGLCKKCSADMARKVVEAEKAANDRLAARSSTSEAQEAPMPDAPTDKIAELLSDRRLRLACQNAALSAETEAMRGDNLAIHLATEISRHPDRPEDDKADDETGWGEWVIERTNEIGDAVVAAVAAVLLRDTPALIAHLEAQGYAVVPREPTAEMVRRAVVAVNEARVQNTFTTKRMAEAAIRAALNPETGQ